MSRSQLGSSDSLIAARSAGTLAGRPVRRIGGLDGEGTVLPGSLPACGGPPAAFESPALALLALPVLAPPVLASPVAALPSALASALPSGLLAEPDSSRARSALKLLPEPAWLP